jgi:hypothetical protein
MRFWLAAGIAAIALAAAAAHPGAVSDFYEQIYPSDAAKRQALELCFLTDHKFNRLDPDQRAACYRERHVISTQVALNSVLPPPTAPASTASTANFVDLWRASGQGNLPQNDIRSQEQNTRYGNAGRSR